MKSKNKNTYASGERVEFVRVTMKYACRGGIVKEKIDAGLSRNGFEGTLPEIEKTHEYVLSFNDLQNYEQIESITFYRWLFLQEDQLLILKKSN